MRAPWKDFRGNDNDDSTTEAWPATGTPTLILDVPLSAVSPRARTVTHAREYLQTRITNSHLNGKKVLHIIVIGEHVR
jgi:hypothetical protein